MSVPMGAEVTYKALLGSSSSLFPAIRIQTFEDGDHVIYMTLREARPISCSS